MKQIKMLPSTKTVSNVANLIFFLHFKVQQVSTSYFQSWKTQKLSLKTATKPTGSTEAGVILTWIYEHWHWTREHFLRNRIKMFLFAWASFWKTAFSFLFHFLIF